MPSQPPADRSVIPGLVSTLTTVRNGAAHLRDAVDSLLGQDDDHFEVVVVNDGSTDQTQAILDSYSDPCLRVLAAPRVGRAQALRLASDHARGEFLAILDGDDIALTYRLAEQRAFLRRHPEIALVGALAIEFGDITERIRPTPTGPASVRRALGMYNPFYFSSVCFRRHAYDDVGGFRVEDQWGYDKAFLVRVASKYPVDIMPEPLIRYRVHEGQITASKMWRTCQRRASANIQLWAAWQLKLAPHLWPFPISGWMYAQLPAALRPRRWKNRIRDRLAARAGILPGERPSEHRRAGKDVTLRQDREAGSQKACVG